MFKHSLKLGPFKVLLIGYTPARNTLKVILAVSNHLTIAPEGYFSMSRIYVSIKSMTH